MPMIDVYATAGTFADPHQLAGDLATALMTIEKVPDIPMFRQNTAAFIHDLPADGLANVRLLTETLERPDIYELARGARDRDLRRRQDLEEQLGSP